MTSTFQMKNIMSLFKNMYISVPYSGLIFTKTSMYCGIVPFFIYNIYQFQLYKRPLKILTQIRPLSFQWLLYFFPNKTRTNKQIKNDINYEDKYIEIMETHPSKIFVIDEVKLNELKTSKMDALMNEINNEKQKYEQQLIEINAEYMDLYDSDDETYTVDINQEKQYKKNVNDVNNELDLLQTKLKDVETMESTCLNESKNEILIESSSNFKNNFVIEFTPLGNVLMTYSDSAFEYYSNSIIPNKILDVVCRKYMITHNCCYLNKKNNIYRSKGKMNNFKFIQPIPKQISSKKKVFSFLDYKKSIL